MVDSDDEGKLGTLLEIKENLIENSVSKWQSLHSVLIGSLNKLDKYKENLKESLRKYDEKVIEYSPTRKKS